MHDLSDDEWRRAFSTWLRSGRVPLVQPAEAAERKFNPWHDPDDGRFTFRGAGVYYGRGSSRLGDKPKKPSRAKVGRRPKRVDGFPGEGGSFGGGGADATTEQPASQTRPSGGSFGGGGASGSWDAPDEQERQSTGSPGNTTKPSAGSAKPREQFRTEVRGSYTYQIDALDRMRMVSGSLTLNDAPVRSRTAQRQAGGADRRTSDDGGHYIAARFNGPTEAFNHFAQDANFNRGGYRLLEEEWAKARRAGKSVTVKIVPYYRGRSTRPYEIDVWFTINGRRKSKKFPNERAEKPRGKQ
jgi:hypothetical protein